MNELDRKSAGRPCWYLLTFPVTRRLRFFPLEMAAVLREFRLKAGLTQTEVARHMGLRRSSGHSFVSQLETGRIEYPFLETIVLYLKACGK